MLNRIDNKRYVIVHPEVIDNKVYVRTIDKSKYLYLIATNLSSVMGLDNNPVFVDPISNRASAMPKDSVPPKKVQVTPAKTKNLPATYTPIKILSTTPIPKE